jgi:UDP-N-acetylmuramoyl-tripeptide--D-alanyl-D-alanine ligase
MRPEDLYSLFLQHPVISTDTRDIKPGCLFFALRGDNFDANTFAARAIAGGAAYAVIDNPQYRVNEKYILVADVLTALQDLARYHRKQLTIPVVGLTGTNGKTTTKELINAVLSQTFNTLATQGNKNNHIGVPLTILSIHNAHEIAVIEMGANHQREIALLCSIAQPTHGLITNIGKAHLEGFGGVEGIKKGKGELYDFLRMEDGDEVGKSVKSESPEDGKTGKSGSPEVGKSGSPEVGELESWGDENDDWDEGTVAWKPGGLAFVNGDDAVLMDMQRNRALQHVVLYGTHNPDNTVVGKLTENSPYLSLEWTNNLSGESYAVKTGLTGAYNLDNILAAICIGVYFKVDGAAINKGVEGYKPQNNRSQIKQTETNALICDYYNANPSSMAVAIENIGKLQAKHKVLILGDMFELGDESPAEHEAIIQKAMDADVNERIFIGEAFLSQKLKFKSQKAVFYKTFDDAVAGLTARPVKNATILIKGSRGMALERLVGLF